MPEISSHYQPESEPNQNEKTKNWLFARLKVGMGKLFYGKEHSQTQKNQERDKLLDAQKDKVYFPPSATIQIDATSQQTSQDVNRYLAEFQLTTGGSVKVYWNNHLRRFAYTGQNIEGLTIQVRADTTLQIKSIHGGICTFDQRVCYAQDAYSRPNKFNQLPSESRKELALERLKHNPRFSKSDEQSPYGYLDKLSIRGVSSERLAGGVYFGSQKAREAVYIPIISEQTPALNQLYQQIIERKNRRGENFAQYVLQDVVELVRAQIPYQTSTDLDRVKTWLKANQLDNDGLISLEAFVQYQIGSCTHLALTTALLLETLIERKVISGRVRIEKTYQPGRGSHASVTYTADSHEIQIDPTKGYIGKRTKVTDGWNYDVTFRMNRQERKALEKTCKAAKLPQRQQDTHQLHERAWQKHDQTEQAKPFESRLKIDLTEPSRTKVENSLRNMPTWVVENITRVVAIPDSEKTQRTTRIAACVVQAPLSVKSQLRCNEDVIELMTQSQLDKLMGHEIGGHVLLNSITSKSKAEGKRIRTERLAFARANFQMLMKDDYAKNILIGNMKYYEARLKHKTAIDPSSNMPPQDERRLTYAIDEFLANRMSEYLQTTAGIEYSQSFHHREKPFTDEENRKCWQFCSMIYQSGEKLFIKQPKQY